MLATAASLMLLAGCVGRGGHGTRAEIGSCRETAAPTLLYPSPGNRQVAAPLPAVVVSGDVAVLDLRVPDAADLEITGTTALPGSLSSLARRSGTVTVFMPPSLARHTTYEVIARLRNDGRRSAACSGAEWDIGWFSTR